MSTAPIDNGQPKGALFAALAKAQSKIRHAVKDSKNPHFNSKYADLAAVAEACREALTENGIGVIQDPFTAGPQVGCVTTLGHASGESFTSRELLMTPRDTAPQTVGSCVTYLRRYQLAAVVGVAPDDDDGNAAQGLPPKGDAGNGKAAAPRANTVKHDGTKASHEQVTLLHVLKSKIGGLTDEAYRKQLSAFKDAEGKPVTSSKDLSPDQISNLLDRYQAQIERQAKRLDEGGRVAPEAAPEPTLGALVDRHFALDQAELRDELGRLFGVDRVAALDKGESETFFQLLLVRGTEQYDEVEAKARALGRVR